MATLVRSFEPIVDDNSQVIILGTMPGKESLEKYEYYGNNRNSFWKIIFTVFNSEPEWSYPKKTAFLRMKGIAIWDVLNECTRDGSSDNKISNEIPNDFNVFFRQHPGISYVFFNGKSARDLFHQHVSINQEHVGKLIGSLPSTSPANARISFDQKVEEWNSIKKYLEIRRK